MVDYGIVSLLILQLGACAGTVVAWLSIRREADRIREATGINARIMSDLQNDVARFGESVRTFENRLSSMEGDIGKACRAAEDARHQTADYKGEIRSIKATIAANRRWNREEEDGSATEPPLPETPLQPPQPAPQVQKESTFGKRVLLP